MNDSLFVQGLRDRDPAAVKHLSECYLPSVWRFVYFRVDGDRHLAEDIISESVVALLRAATTDTDIRHPSAWLRSVASHKIQDHFRAAARVQHLIDSVKHTKEVADENDAAKQIEVSERRVVIRQVMDELPERNRVALEWKYIEQLSVREIAGRLDTTEKSAESILFRARREFREKLTRLEDQAEDDDRQSSCRSHRPDCGPSTAATTSAADEPGENHPSDSASRTTDLTR